MYAWQVNILHIVLLNSSHYGSWLITFVTTLDEIVELLFTRHLAMKNEVLAWQKCRKCTYILVVKLSWMPWKDRRLTVFMFVRIAYLKEIKEETFIMIDHCISTVLIWWYHKCICNWKFSPKQKFNILDGGQHQSQSNEKHFKPKKEKKDRLKRECENARTSLSFLICSSLTHLFVGDFDNNNYQWERPFCNE